MGELAAAQESLGMKAMTPAELKRLIPVDTNQDGELEVNEMMSAVLLKMLATEVPQQLMPLAEVDVGDRALLLEVTDSGQDPANSGGHVNGYMHV